MIIEPENYDNGFFRLAFQDRRYFYAAFWMDGQTEISPAQMTEVEKPIRITEGRLSKEDGEGGYVYLRHALGGDQLEEFKAKLESRGLILP